MGYKSNKGYKGEKAMASELTEAVEEFGFKVERIGQAETNKHFLNGDTGVVNDPDGKCVLSDYFLESKKQSQPSVWKTNIEAHENAKKYGKKGYIARIERSVKGKRYGGGGNPDKIYIMREETLQNLIYEIQAWRQWCISEGIPFPVKVNNIDDIEKEELYPGNVIENKHD